MWRDGEFPEMFQPYIEYFNGGSHNNGSRKLFPIFDDPRRTGLSFPSAMVGVLQCLEGVVSKAGASGRRNNMLESTSIRPKYIIKVSLNPPQPSYGSFSSKG